MTVKFLLGVAIVAFTSYCGFFMAKKYRKRKQFFTQLKEFNERFLTEISYYRRPLADFLTRYAYKGEFRIFLNNYYADLEDLSQSPQKSLSFEHCEFIKSEEKTVVEDYFKMLGKGDSSSQKTYFSAAKEQLVKLQNAAETEYKKYGDLYVKLGFLCGLFILILII